VYEEEHNDSHSFLLSVTQNTLWYAVLAYVWLVLLCSPVKHVVVYH
jgi:hypothetical protein